MFQEINNGNFMLFGHLNF